MRQEYVVRPLAKHDSIALDLRYAVFEVVPDGERMVALCFEEAYALRISTALQQFSETGTKPLGALPKPNLPDTQPKRIA
jgi:hypothetical protein